MKEAVVLDCSVNSLLLFCGGFPFFLPLFPFLLFSFLRIFPGNQRVTRVVGVVLEDGTRNDDLLLSKHSISFLSSDHALNFENLGVPAYAFAYKLKLLKTASVASNNLCI